MTSSRPSRYEYHLNYVTWVLYYSTRNEKDEMRKFEEEPSCLICFEAFRTLKTCIYKCSGNQKHYVCEKCYDTMKEKKECPFRCTNPETKIISQICWRAFEVENDLGLTFYGCPYTPCRVIMEQSRLDQHIKKCPNRPIRCPECQLVQSTHHSKLAVHLEHAHQWFWSTHDTGEIPIKWTTSPVAYQMVIPDMLLTFRATSDTLVIRLMSYVDSAQSKQIRLYSGDFNWAINCPLPRCDDDQVFELKFPGDVLEHIKATPLKYSLGPDKPSKKRKPDDSYESSEEEEEEEDSDEPDSDSE